MAANIREMVALMSVQDCQEYTYNICTRNTFQPYKWPHYIAARCEGIDIVMANDAGMVTCTNENSIPASLFLCSSEFFSWEMIVVVYQVALKSTLRLEYSVTLRHASTVINLVCVVTVKERVYRICTLCDIYYVSVLFT